MMRHIRRWIYLMGIRPKPESIFYSPSLSYLMSARKSLAEGFKAGIDQAMVDKVYREREEDQL